MKTTEQLGRDKLQYHQNKGLQGSRFIKIRRPTVFGLGPKPYLRKKIAPCSPTIPGQAPEKLTNSIAIKERNHTRNVKRRVAKKAGVRLLATRAAIHKWGNRHNRIAFRGVKTFGRR